MFVFGVYRDGSLAVYIFAGTYQLKQERPENQHRIQPLCISVVIIYPKINYVNVVVPTYSCILI